MALVILVLATSVSFGLGFFVGRSAVPVNTVIKEIKAPVINTRAPQMQSVKPAQKPIVEVAIIKADTLEVKTALKPSPPRRIKSVRAIKVEPVKVKTVSSGQIRYSVQVGAFVTLKDAERIRKDFKARGYEAYVLRVGDTGEKAVFKVRLGEFIESDSARLLALKLKSIEGLSAFVVRND